MKRRCVEFDLPSYVEMEQKCYNFMLEGTEVFEVLLDSEKEAEWNGFGPDRFPRWLRAALSLYELEILPACYIHDLDFAVGGSKKYFYRSNRRFRKNALKCIEVQEQDIKFIRKVCLKFKIHAIEAICNLFGYKGWNKR